jgi:hypothetical protein
VRHSLLWCVVNAPAGAEGGGWCKVHGFGCSRGGAIWLYDANKGGRAITIVAVLADEIRQPRMLAALLACEQTCFNNSVTQLIHLRPVCHVERSQEAEQPSWTEDSQS